MDQQRLDSIRAIRARHAAAEAVIATERDAYQQACDHQLPDGRSAVDVYGNRGDDNQCRICGKCDV